MLRELQVTMHKPANAQYKSGEAKVMTGMAVVKDEVNKTFGFAGTATADDLFFVDAERIPTGLNTIRTNISDYDPDFTELAQGEFGKLIAYYVGERIATDQVVMAGLAVGDRLMAGTDGKLVKATVASRYIYQGEFDDAGHTLAIVEVSDIAKTN